MKKIIITFLSTCLLTAGLKAQTIQEGMTHLYSGRPNNAATVFQKLLAVNPNNIEASYWLGLAHLDKDEIMSTRISNAKKVYEQAAQASNNAPLIQVGLGHIALLQNKPADARQLFESALTATRTRKGDDPVITTAIGRAVIDSKNGDFAYAVRLLEDAASKEPKNVDILLQLGNAYRKAGQGSGGGQAYETYKKALVINPGFAMASFRLSQLFQSQRNMDFVLQYLNEAIQKDSKFTLAYYELFYYYFFNSKFSEAEEQLKKYIDSKLPDTDIQDQYLYAQLCWARKDFDCAISKANTVIAAMNENTKPKVYRLLADAYTQKNDLANAKKYSDLFFEKKNPEDIILPDYEIRAIVQTKMNSSPDEIMNTYLQGVALDTSVDAKVEFLKKGILSFKESKQRDYEAKLISKLIEIKPKPTINDYFDLTVAHYFAQNYAESRNQALGLIEKYPDQVYGYEWAYNNSIAVDTVKQDSIAAPDALKLYEFTITDTTKFKRQYISSVRYLAAYYINIEKNKEKSLDFFTKWLEADSANASTIQGYIEQIKKMPNSSNGSAPKSKPSKPAPTPKAKTSTSNTVLSKT